MKKNKFVVLIVFLVVAFSARCVIASNSEPIVLNKIKQATQKNVSAEEHSGYMLLIDSLPNKSMRSDGLKKMAMLKRKYLQAIPLIDIVLLFESLVKRYPLENNERLIYQFSKVLEVSGRINEAYNSFNRLIKKYPKTEFYDKAQFHKAEILYAKKQYAKAENSYRIVIAFRKHDDKSTYYEQAVYKQGWAQFKQTHYVSAVNSFMHLLDLHIQNDGSQLKTKTESEKKFIEMVMQAINVSFVYQSGVISAYRYFSRNKREFEDQVFLSLAQFYQNNNNLADAVKTYHLFVSFNKTHLLSPIFLLNVIELYKKSGLIDLEIAAKKYFVQQYAIDNVYWGLHGPKKTSRQRLALNVNLYHLAKHYHRLAKKTLQRVYYREAQRWYRIWLTSFPNDSKVANMRFQLAEILNQNMQYDLAAIEYENVAYDYPNYEKSAQAGHSALLMHTKKEQKLTGFVKQQWHKYGVGRALRFAKQFPKHKESNYILARAEKDLKKITKQKAKTKNNEQQTIINSNVSVERVTYEAALAFMLSRDWAQAAIALEKIRVEYPEHVLIKEVIKQLALVYLELGDASKASLEFVKISFFPENINAQEEALWLAADLSEQAGDDKQAVMIYMAFIKRFSLPLTQSVEARQRLIELYERNEKYNEAGQWRTKLINADAKGERQRTERTRYLAANASFALAESAFEHYRKIELTFPLDKKLQLKRNMMNKVIGFYDRAASYNIADSLTASTYRIAQIYYDLALAIYRSERPKKLNEKKLKKYNALLKQKATPYERKAIEFHKLNLSYVKPDKYTVWSNKSLQQLKKLPKNLQ